MTDHNLHQIDNKPLREKVLDILREAIVSGELKPGQALVEMELASQLGISRAPLREALQVLSREGLVETAPYRGTIVRNLSRTDIEELYSLRTVLEEFAIRRVITLNPPGAVPRLRKHFEDMLAAAEANNLRQMNHIDRLFHDTLIEFSGHKLLAATWSSVSMRVQQVMALRNLSNSDLKQVAYNHEAIVQAVADCREEEAVKLIHQHITTAGNLIAEMWEDSELPNTTFPPQYPVDEKANTQR